MVKMNNIENKTVNLNNNIIDIINIIVDTFKENESKINNLNVFPVPDGDTGTNMLLTLKSIQKELLNSDIFDLKTISDKISYGALMGARGNSGVILSQILKGFFDIIIKKEVINFETLKEAAKSSMELAYSSVQNPTEGTILTTIKDIYKFLESINTNSNNGNNFNNFNNFNDYLSLLDIIIHETEKSVLRTTYLLPVLKQAGVVDAGAQGLLVILIGLKKALKDISSVKKEKVSIIDNNDNKEREAKEEQKNIEKTSQKIEYISQTGLENEEETLEPSNLKKLDLISEIKNIYCTELIVKGENINLTGLRQDIENLGDSALVVGSSNLVKIHVHTNYPQKVLHRALKEGTIHDIQINNMIDQSKQAASTETIEEIKDITKETIIVAIANGEGFEEIFKSLGVDIVIKGGQSMNPSTYEIVKAISKTESNNIILLPNNKNIILTANQAKKIIKKNIFVIPTTTIPQGIAAALIFNPDLTIEENLDNMNKAISTTKTGEVTRAVRDANLFVGKIKKGDYIGLADGKVKVISDNLIDCVLDLLRDMVTGNEEVVTFYFGQEVTLDDNKKIKEKINNLFPQLEIEFHKGGQPLYPYIFSVE